MNAAQLASVDTTLKGQMQELLERKRQARDTLLPKGDDCAALARPNRLGCSHALQAITKLVRERIPDGYLGHVSCTSRRDGMMTTESTQTVELPKCTFMFTRMLPCLSWSSNLCFVNCLFTEQVQRSTWPRALVLSSCQ